MSELDPFSDSEAEAVRKANAEIEMPDFFSHIVEPSPLDSAGERRYDAAKAGVRWVDTVAPEAVSWIWEPFVPARKLTLLEGDPGEGKSWLTLAIAAGISQGWLPGGDLPEPSTVLVLTAEDGIADTVRPRLDSLGADLTKIAVFDGVAALDDAGFDHIERAIEHVGPVFTVLDPLVAYLGGGVDMHRANETREVMARLGEVGERRETAIMPVRHLNKGGSGRAIYRGLGSIDLTASCRSVLLAGSDPNNRQDRALVQIKSNLAPFGDPIGYRIGHDGFAWTETDLTADRILSAEPNSEDKSARQEAREFLETVLDDGPRPSAEIEEEADAFGISKRTLARAKKELRIDTNKVGYGSDGRWYWSLPKATN